MKLKLLFLPLTLLIISSCATDKKTLPNFMLSGAVEGDYVGYIYLKYNIYISYIKNKYIISNIIYLTQKI